MTIGRAHGSTIGACAVLTLAASVLLIGCRVSGPSVTRISARPFAPTTRPMRPGRHPLGLGTTFYRGQLRDGTLYVPTSGSHDQTPLFVLLHGGGGQASDFDFMMPLAEEYGVSLLTLDARDNTWDGVDSPFGPDVQFIDAALRYTFERVPIDPSRIALGGMSDGGMYALSVGRINGDLFTHLIAFAPGYMQSPSPPVGQPRIFIGHGTRDNVYNAAGSRMRLVPQLRRAGYDVTYYEFDGPHFITPPAARAALGWLVAQR